MSQSQQIAEKYTYLQTTTQNSTTNSVAGKKAQEPVSLFRESVSIINHINSSNADISRIETRNETRRSETRRSQTPQRETARPSLKNQTDVVCLLMVIEIERLLNENDKFKYKLKEIEDRYLDRNSYEFQITDLQKRYDELVNQSIIEKQETITITTQLETQIHQWKEIQQMAEKDNQLKYQILERRFREQQQENDRLQEENKRMNDEHQKEIKMIYDQTELEKTLIIDREVSIISRKSVQDKEFYENDIRRLKNQFEERSKEVNDLRQKNQDQQYIIDMMQKQEQKYQDCEKQLQLAKFQVDQLNNTLIAKLEELEGWKQKYLKLDQKLKDQEHLVLKQIQDFENKIYGNQFTDHWILDMQQSEQYFRDLIAKQEANIRERDNKQFDWDQQYRTLLTENDNLRNSLLTKDYEIEKLNEDFMANQVKYTSMTESLIREYEYKISSKDQELDKLIASLMMKMEDIKIWKQSYDMKKFPTSSSTTNSQIHFEESYKVTHSHKEF